MATNLDIIKRAMKKIHVLGSGADPSAAQAAAAMASLQSLIVELLGLGTLGRVYDVLASSDTTALEWQRIRIPDDTVTITLPTTITSAMVGSWPYLYPWSGVGPDYGWWYRGYCWAYPRPPVNMSPVVVVNMDTGEEVISVYSAYKGAWVTINDLTQQGDFPFASHYEDGFAAMLAERIVDDYAQELGVNTAKQAAACRMMLSAKYDSPAVPTIGSYM